MAGQPVTLGVTAQADRGQIVRDTVDPGGRLRVGEAPVAPHQQFAVGNRVRHRLEHRREVETHRITHGINLERVLVRVHAGVGGPAGQYVHRDLWRRSGASGAGPQSRASAPGAQVGSAAVAVRTAGGLCMALPVALGWAVGDIGSGTAGHDRRVHRVVRRQPPLPVPRRISGRCGRLFRGLRGVRRLGRAGALGRRAGDLPGRRAGHVRVQRAGRRAAGRLHVRVGLRGRHRAGHRTPRALARRASRAGRWGVGLAGPHGRRCVRVPAPGAGVGGRGGQGHAGIRRCGGYRGRWRRRGTAPPRRCTSRGRCWSTSNPHIGFPVRR